MWSYYGRKSKLVHLYPDPKHDVIIEPFAGTACYALYKDNWERSVILRDVNPKIIRIWKWLQAASPGDILSLPDVGPGVPIPKSGICKEADWLIAFWANRGSEQPRNISGRYSNISRIWEKAKSDISDNLHKIRHWDIQIGDYRHLPNIKATWFIDPPYQCGGDRYAYCEPVDFPSLGQWCQQRLGQVIVCENEPADWLPFSLLKDFRGQRTSTKELAWIR